MDNDQNIKNAVIECYKQAFKDPYENEMNVRVFYDPSKNKTLYVEYIGHSDCEYANGQYFFSLELGGRYPVKPPKLRFLTESGRFYVNNMISCSVSEVHPEYWCQMDLYSLICAIISMFQDDEIYGIGHIRLPKEKRTEIAKQTIPYNNEHNKELILEFKTNGFPSFEDIELGKNYNAHKKGASKERLAELKEELNKTLEERIKILNF